MSSARASGTLATIRAVAGLRTSMVAPAWALTSLPSIRNLGPLSRKVWIAGSIATAVDEDGACRFMVDCLGWPAAPEGALVLLRYSQYAHYYPDGSMHDMVRYAP